MHLTWTHHKVIKGFDIAVTGLSVGGTRKSRIPPVDAYGEVDPEARVTFPTQGSPGGLKEGIKVRPLTRKSSKGRCYALTHESSVRMTS